MTQKQKADWLSDYITRIEDEISSDKLNRHFDSAKYFEVFAREVCCVWFNTGVRFLNEKNEYPGVDLFVSDGIYIQVTTEKNLQNKIRKTLTEIEKSDDPRLIDVRTVYFFVLSNENEDKLKTVHSARFDFDPSVNLISTKAIKIRVKDDYQFCNALYDRLYSADTELTSYMHKIDALFDAAEVYHKNCTSSLLFRRDVVLPDSKILLIRGDGWTGKTSLALSCVSEENDFIVLFGERMTHNSSLSEVIGLDIGLYLSLSGKPLVILLENLHQCRYSESTELIICQLCELPCKYDNVSLIITCSANDSGWDDFLKNKHVTEFRIPPLSDNELDTIISERQNLTSAIRWQSIRKIIHNPAMLAAVLDNVQNDRVIDSVKTLRNAVWNRIGKCRHKVFTQIALNCLGIGCPDTAEVDYDSMQVESLLRDGLLVMGREGRIRPASFFYSETAIFHYLSGIFYDSGRDFSDFFQNIQMNEQARNVYVVNWLREFMDESRENRSSVLRCIFGNSLQSDDDWSLMLKAVAGADGIYEDLIGFGPIFQDDRFLPQIISAVNAYGFRNNGDRRIPCGDMRVFLMLSDNDYIKTEQKVIWAEQYAEYEVKKTDWATSAARILVDYLDSQEKDSGISGIDKLLEIKLSLVALSKLSDTASDITEAFLDHLIEARINDNRYVRDIALITVDSACCRFAKYFPEKMTKLGEKVWFNTKKRIPGSFLTTYEMFGLIHEVPPFVALSDVNNADYSFFCLLFYFYFDYAVKWMTGFLNRVVSSFNENSGKSLHSISVSCPDGVDRKYLGSRDLWVMHFRNTAFPRILKGISCAFFNVLCLKIEELLSNGEDLFSFINSVLNYILEHSNNVTPLSVLATIGTMYFNELPGFCILFVSDVRFFEWDFFRIIPEADDPVIQLDSLSLFSLHIAPFCCDGEKLIARIKKRPHFPLTKVFQMYYGVSDDLASQCKDAVCRLRNSLPDNVDDLTHYLIWQIDLHKEADGSYYVNVPDDSVVRHIRQTSLDLEKTYRHLNFSLEKDNNDLSLEQCEEIISQKCDASDLPECLFRYEVLFYVLKQKSLAPDKREKYIGMLPGWDNLRSLPQQQVLSILLMQTEFNMSREAEVRILKIIYSALLDIIHGRYKISRLFKDYPVISRRLFHALVWDSMLENNHDRNIWRGDRAYFKELEKYLRGDKVPACKQIDFRNCNFEILTSVFYCGLSADDEEFCHFIKELIKFMQKQKSALQISGAVSTYLSTQLFEDDSDRVIDILFSVVEDPMPKWMIDMYCKSLDVACRYYDGWRNPCDREKVRKIINRIENMNDSRVQEGSDLHSALDLVSMLLPFNSYGSWSNIETHYHGYDKIFLIRQYEKYYESHPAEVIQAALEMNLYELMPDALPVIASAFTRINGDSEPILCLRMLAVLKKILDDIALLTFIKQDKRYSVSVFSILDCMDPCLVDLHKLRSQFLQIKNDAR